MERRKSRRFFVGLIFRVVNVDGGEQVWERGEAKLSKFIR
jgi:hypothetical protein